MSNIETMPTDDEIREMVVHLLKPLVDRLPQGEPGEFALYRRREGDYGYWELLHYAPGESPRDGREFVYAYPSLLASSAEQYMVLSLQLYDQLKSHFKIKRANASRSVETRRAIAKKAVEARWSRAKLADK